MAARPVYIDDYDVVEFGELAARFPQDRYGYVVTPNVDHLIRYCADEQFRGLYAAASYVLLDSRFLSHWLALWRRQRLRVCPGSDLTALLLQRLAGSAERLVLVGATATQAALVAQQFRLSGLTHIDPPMGFIAKPEEVERCLTAIEAAAPFRYCLLAIGSPQQELIAHQLQLRGRARGLVLCIGASINFLTGSELRAPRLLRRLGLEWLFRLLQNPRRLARRYLARGPRIFWLLPRLRFVSRRVDRQRLPA